MIRVAEVVKGMRVLTPTGRIARVEGLVVNTEDLFRRVSLRYYDAQDETVALQPKLLRAYDGDSIVFRDEMDSLRMRHGDVPLPPQGGSAHSAPPLPDGVVRPSTSPTFRPHPRSDDEGRG